jgi:hypothetical protein
MKNFWFCQWRDLHEYFNPAISYSSAKRVYWENFAFFAVISKAVRDKVKRNQREIKIGPLEAISFWEDQ